MCLTRNSEVLRFLAERKNGVGRYLEDEAELGLTQIHIQAEVIAIDTGGIDQADRPKPDEFPGRIAPLDVWLPTVADREDRAGARQKFVIYLDGYEGVREVVLARVGAGLSQVDLEEVTTGTNCGVARELAAAHLQLVAFANRGDVTGKVSSQELRPCDHGG